MVEEKGGGGGELPPTLRECTAADAQCCRRSGRHTREQRLQPNNRKLPLEVMVIFIHSTTKPTSSEETLVIKLQRKG